MDATKKSRKLIRPLLLVPLVLVVALAVGCGDDDDDGGEDATSPPSTTTSTTASTTTTTAVSGEDAAFLQALDAQGLRGELSDEAAVAAAQSVCADLTGGASIEFDVDETRIAPVAVPAYCPEAQAVYDSMVGLEDVIEIYPAP